MAFFAALGHRLDGDMSFDESDALYVLLDGLRLKEEARSLARFVVEDFADFAARRKDRARSALLIVDEYSVIADAARVFDLVERLRSFNVGVVLAPQVESGMGNEAAADRVHRRFTASMEEHRPSNFKHLPDHRLELATLLDGIASSRESRTVNAEIANGQPPIL